MLQYYCKNVNNNGCTFLIFLADRTNRIDSTCPVGQEDWASKANAAGFYANDTSLMLRVLSGDYLDKTYLGEPQICVYG